MLRLWTTLHVLSAVVLFGPSFAFPFIGAVAQKGGDVKTALRISDLIGRKLLVPADIVLPVTGVLIIVSSKSAFDPFEPSGRWLLSAIVLFTIMVLIGNLVQMPTMKKALTLADRNEFGPEFGKLMQKQKKFGMILGMLLMIIVVLMVAKPGI